MRKRRFTAILALMALVLTSAFAEARVFHVSPDGSGTDCTQASPCALQDALDAAKANGEDDTVNLLAGTYEGNFRCDPPDTEHKSITIKGAEGTTPLEVVLDGRNSGRVLSMYDWSGGNLAAVLIEGLTIRNGSNTSSGGGLDLSLKEYDITVRNCVIHGNTGSDMGGGAFLDSEHTVVFERNVVHDNTVNERPFRAGYRSWGGGVSIFAHAAYISNNLIYGNRAQGEQCSPCGGGLWTNVTRQGGFYLINNTIARNEAVQGGGVFAAYGQHCFYNNIIYQNDAAEGTDIYLKSSASNTAYNNAYAGLYGSWSEEDGNIAVDPVFVAPDRGDFHLSAESPCINAGTNNVPGPPGLPDTDFEGDQRIINGAVDIGADEYTQGYSSGNSAAAQGVAVARMKDDGTVYLYVPSLLLSDSEGRLETFELLFRLEDLQSIAFRLQDARVLTAAPGPVSAFFNPAQSLLYIEYVALIDQSGSTTIFKNFTFDVTIPSGSVLAGLRDFMGDHVPTVTEYVGGEKEVGSGVPQDVAQRYLGMMSYIENLIKDSGFTTPQSPASSGTFNWDIQDW